MKVSTSAIYISTYLYINRISKAYIKRGNTHLVDNILMFECSEPFAQHFNRHGQCIARGDSHPCVHYLLSPEKLITKEWADLCVYCVTRRDRDERERDRVRRSEI
jgi:hypothetical protein